MWGSGGVLDLLSLSLGLSEQLGGWGAVNIHCGPKAFEGNRYQLVDPVVCFVPLGGYKKGEKVSGQFSDFTISIVKK